jgi:hypothetical protein
MRFLSVETCESRIDVDAAAQDPGEAVARPRLLEALEPPARIDAAAGQRAPGREPAVHRCEPL